MEFAPELQTKGRVYVEYPESLKDAVASAMDAWKAFCALPNETKLLFPYEADTTMRSGNGYELKLEEGATLDKKEDFQLRLSAQEQVLSRAKGINTSEVTRFVNAALKLPELIAPLLKQFAENVEKEFNSPGFVNDVTSATPELIIRFLHYFGDTKPGEEIAKPHVDKGGFTLHLSESDAGVEQLQSDGSWTSLPVSHEQTVIFPALGLQYRLENQVKALCHRVVATPDVALNGRYSAVCFVVFRNSAAYDKEHHGRLQDKPVGFNYDMPWDEFKKLFK